VFELLLAFAQHFQVVVVHRAVEEVLLFIALLVFLENLELLLIVVDIIVIGAVACDHFREPVGWILVVDLVLRVDIPDWVH
jgi:hypothetical protein